MPIEQEVAGDSGFAAGGSDGIFGASLERRLEVLFEGFDEFGEGDVLAGTGPDQHGHLPWIRRDLGDPLGLAAMGFG